MKRKVQPQNVEVIGPKRKPANGNPNRWKRNLNVDGNEGTTIPKKQNVNVDNNETQKRKTESRIQNGPKYLYILSFYNFYVLLFIYNFYLFCYLSSNA